jgi:hypothetical protein
MCRGRIIVGSDERHMGGAEPSQKVFLLCPLSVVLFESLRTRYERMCDLCVSAITDILCRSATRRSCLGYPVHEHETRPVQSVVKNLY